MAQPRILYEDGRPYTVPETLEELTGPTSGVVELPVRLDWSEQGRYDLSDPKQLCLMYERVIREPRCGRWSIQPAVAASRTPPSSRTP
jgi:hypothetical protein